MKIKNYLLLAAAAMICACSSSNNSDSASENEATAALYDGEINKHPYVDLGLSVFWSPLNICADSLSDKGNYVAWGEVDTAKTEFAAANCETFQKSYAREMQGNIDHDVARNLWKHTWRLPTKEEFAELIEKCEWTKDTVDLIAGYTVKGPNGKTIFLPCAGFKSAETEAPDSCSGQGYYWSGSHTRGRAEKAKAFCLTIGVADSATVVELERYNGLCIRPVSNK